MVSSLAPSVLLVALTAMAHGAEQVPPGPLRSQLDRMALPSRSQVVEHIRAQAIPERDLAASVRAGAHGRLAYACRPYAGRIRAAAAPLRITAAAAVPISQPPALSSRPGSARRIYIDVNGMEITGTAWNNDPETGNVARWRARPYDTDGDPATFSPAEQAAITEIWRRVAEDYAIFDVDVTTIDPGPAAPSVGRILITPSRDADGVDLPFAEAGGVAFLSVFGDADYPFFQPAFAYIDNLANGDPAVVAEAAAHEMGHNLGLFHDGTTTSEYYDGHGIGLQSWAPIMGTSYDAVLTQWSRGEYDRANNLQDDRAVMGARIPLLADDVVADRPLILGTGGIIGDDPAHGGVIESGDDRDAFAVVTGPGRLRVTAEPVASLGTNLDLRLHLVVDDVLIATAAPSGTFSATIDTEVSGGLLRLVVIPGSQGSPTSPVPSGWTEYGSLGAYRLRGEAPLPVVSALLVAGATGVVRGAPDLGIEVAYVGVDAASLGGDDLRVVRLGEGTLAVASSGAPVSDGAGVRQRYRLPAPGGFWDDTDGGVYRIDVAPDAVRSSTGAALPVTSLGQFIVMIPAPRIDILDASVDEPVSGTAALRFPIRLSASTGRSVTATWSTTAAAAARAGSDFLSASGAITIPPGGIETTVDIIVLADQEEEPVEDLAIVLTDSQGAAAGRLVAVGRILSAPHGAPAPGSGDSGGGGGGCGAGSLSAVWMLLAGGLTVLRLRGRRH
jgi:hypothetical protein